MGCGFAGVAIDQGIAYVLMLVALAITYIIHWAVGWGCNSRGVDSGRTIIFIVLEHWFDLILYWFLSSKNWDFSFHVFFLVNCKLLICFTCISSEFSLLFTMCIWFFLCNSCMNDYCSDYAWIWTKLSKSDNNAFVAKFILCIESS